MIKEIKMSELKHYGIPGQKKGIRRWQNADGSFNEEGKKRYGRIGKGIRNYKNKLSDMSDRDFARSYKRHMATTGAAAALVYGVNGLAASRGKLSSNALLAFNIGSIAATAGLNAIGKIKISEMARRIGVDDWGTPRIQFKNYGFGFNSKAKESSKKMYEYLRNNK